MWKQGGEECSRGRMEGVERTELGVFKELFKY